jgi:hypothetical protein
MTSVTGKTGTGETLSNGTFTVQLETLTILAGMFDGGDGHPFENYTNCTEVDSHQSGSTSNDVSGAIATQIRTPGTCTSGTQSFDTTGIESDGWVTVSLVITPEFSETDASTAGTSTVTGVSDDASLVSSDFYFDGNVSITDAGNDWNNDANAFDGSTATSATSGPSPVDDLIGRGTTYSAVDGAVVKAEFRVYWAAAIGSDGDVEINFGGGTDVLGSLSITGDIPAGAWSEWIDLDFDLGTGGLNTSVLQDLQARCDRTAGSSAFAIYKVELRVWYRTGYAYTWCYADASDAGPTDTGADWNNDSFAFNGLLSNNADKSNTDTGTLDGTGTTVPTTGSTILEVKSRIYGSPNTLSFNVYHSAELLLGPSNAPATTGWGDWDNVSAPTGGWTWQKVNDLEVRISQAGAVGGVAYAIQFQVYSYGPTPTVVSSAGVATVTGNSGTVFVADATSAGSATVTAVPHYGNKIVGFYFDESDETATGTNWTNPSNAFDGLPNTTAYLPVQYINELSAGGTNAPTTGETIVLVEFNAYGNAGSYDDVDFEVFTNGKGESLGSINTGATNFNGGAGWTALSAPTGGWTWQKINDLEVYINPTYTSGFSDINLRLVTLRVILGDVTVDTSTYYIDGSDVAVAGANWNNLANAVDGSDTTYADIDNPDIGALTATGTNSPTTGALITNVRGRVKHYLNNYAYVNLDYEWESLTIWDTTVAGDIDPAAYTDWVDLNVARGGWNWQQVSELKLIYTPFTPSAGGEARLYIAEVEVEYLSGTTTIESDADSAGTATVTGLSEALKKTDADSTAVATVTGLVAAIRKTDADTTAVAAVTGLAAYVTEAVGTSAGVAAVTGVSGKVCGTEADTTASGTVIGLTDTIFSSIASSNGTSTVTGNSEALKKTEFTVTGTATVTGVGETVQAGAIGSSVGVATVTGNTATVLASDADSVGAATVVGNSEAIIKTDLSATGLAVTDINAAAIWLTDTSSIAQATTSADSGSIKATDATSTASSSVSGDSQLIIVTDANAAGTATVSINSGADKETVTTSSGVASSSITTSTLLTTIGSIAGTATVTGVGADGQTQTEETDADSAGTATVIGLSEKLAKVDANSVGTATVTGLSEKVAKTTGSATGTAVTTFNTARVLSADADSTGVATVSGDTGADKGSVAVSAGIASVSGIASSTYETTAIAVATATVTGNSSKIAGVVATSAGIATATGVTPAYYDFEGFRFRYDNGDEDNASWRAAQDIDITEDKGVRLRLRTLISVSGDPGPKQVTLQVRKVGEPDTDWRDV